MTSTPLHPKRIALFTDFGVSGPYTGQMKVVTANAGVPVIDLQSDAPSRDPCSSAYLLAALADCMPEGTLFLSVIDPGVGVERKPLIVQTSRHWFIGPDNGLFSQVIKRDCLSVDVISWRPEVLSDSFHGRDLFAPVAVKICRHQRVESVSLDPKVMVGMDWPEDRPNIIYVDHYGNLVTGIRAVSVEQWDLIEAGGQLLSYSRTFGEVPSGTPFWYINSIGLVELAVNMGSAGQALDLGIGHAIKLHNRSLPEN